MKLSSTAKLRLVTLGIATTLTASIGTLVTVQSYQSSLQAIDTAINSTVDDAIQAPNQELSAALFHIDQFSLDVSLFLISRDGSITTVNESTIELFNEISIPQVVFATKEVRDGSGVHDYRYRAHEISGGDYLVVAASSEDAHDKLKAGLATVALITVLTSLLVFLFLSLYILARPIVLVIL